MVEHAKQEPVARAQLAPAAPEEQDDVFEPSSLELYLDRDGLYRWYEEGGAASEQAAPTLRGAVAAGQRAWSNFVLVAIRGRVIESGEDVPDARADTEIAEIDGSGPA